MSDKRVWWRDDSWRSVGENSFWEEPWRQQIGEDDDEHGSSHSTRRRRCMKLDRDPRDESRDDEDE
jgi:hypothetical protein